MLSNQKHQGILAIILKGSTIIILAVFIGHSSSKTAFPPALDHIFHARSTRSHSGGHNITATKVMKYLLKTLTYTLDTVLIIQTGGKLLVLPQLDCIWQFNSEFKLKCQ